MKPSHEPVVVARKPLAGTVAANVLEHGTGALNIDGCRIGHNEPEGKPSDGLHGKRAGIMGETVMRHRETTAASVSGRWPANVALSPEAAAELDRQSGELHSQDPRTRQSRSQVIGVTEFGTGESVEYGDTGGASRFFYTAKSSRVERTAGVGANAHPT